MIRIRQLMSLVALVWLSCLSFSAEQRALSTLETVIKSGKTVAERISALEEIGRLNLVGSPDVNRISRVLVLALKDDVAKVRLTAVLQIGGDHDADITSAGLRTCLRADANDWKQKGEELVAYTETEGATVLEEFERNISTNPAKAYKARDDYNAGIKEFRDDLAERAEVLDALAGELGQRKGEEVVRSLADVMMVYRACRLADSHGSVWALDRMQVAAEAVLGIGTYSSFECVVDMISEMNQQCEDQRKVVKKQSRKRSKNSAVKEAEALMAKLATVEASALELYDAVTSHAEGQGLRAVPKNWRSKRAWSAWKRAVKHQIKKREDQATAR